MSADDDIDFLRAREAEERLAAANSINPAVADVHFALADRYADRIWSIEEGTPGDQQPLIAIPNPAV